MKKFLIPAIILIGGALLWFFVGTESGSTQNPLEKYAVKATDQISSIALTSTSGERVELSRDGKHWIVNGQFRARKQAISNLLGIIKRVRVNYPVSQTAHANVMRDIEEESVKVEIFLKNKSVPVKTYYVGGPTTNSKGTHMLLETEGKKSAHPDVCYMPGFEGYLTSVYLTDAAKWRTRLVFDTPVDEIQQLTIDYPENPMASFRIVRFNRDSVRVEPLNDQGKAEHRKLNLNTLRSYMKHYESISIEAYENDYPHIDSILEAQPYCTIELVSANEESTKATLLFRDVTKRSKAQFDVAGNPMKYDVDRFWAYFEPNKDFTIIQTFVFGKLFVSYDYFFTGKPSA